MDESQQSIIEIVDEIENKVWEEINARILRPILKKAFINTPDAQHFLGDCHDTRVRMSDGKILSTPHPRLKHFEALEEATGEIEYAFPRIASINNSHEECGRDYILKNF
jgi:hypothetical protein